MKAHDRVSITDEMIARARQLWLDVIDFDFVECTNPECPTSFFGLVELGGVILDPEITGYEIVDSK